MGRATSRLLLVAPPHPRVTVVDPERIGVIGHSLGGHNSLFVATFDERLKAVVTSSGFNSFAKYYGGDLAVVICRILRIKGGLAMHLLGVNPRYATRELVYRGIYPESSEQQTFTGRQVSATIRVQPASIMALVVGGETTTSAPSL